MREIKYKVNNGFVRDEICYAVIKDNEEGTLFRYWDEDEDDWLACCDIRIYTGLKDKNGIECYEGDIVETYGGFKYEVKFSNGSFRLGDYLDPTSYLDSDTFTIIGNIYENPELLKGE